MQKLKKSSHSLYLLLGISITFIVISIITIHSAYMYVDSKAQIIENMHKSSEESIIYLEKNIANLIEAYAVSEYENLIITEMERRDSFVIVVEDFNMGKILGKPSYISGKIRDKNGNIVDFDPESSDHKKALKECYYIEDIDIISTQENKLIGSIKICTSDELINEELNRTIKDTLIDAVVITLVLLFAIFGVIRIFFLRPISEIISIIERSGEDGIPEERFPLQGSNEINLLSLSMNKMIESIKTSKEELKELNETLEERIESKIEEIRQKDIIIQEQTRKKALDRLLVDLAHQWRQPLNSASLQVQGIEYFIEGHKDEKEIVKIIESVANELSTLSDTITKLTTYYEREAGEMISLKEGIEKTFEISGESYSSANMDIILDIDEKFSIKAKANEWVDVFSVLLNNTKDALELRGRGEGKVKIYAKEYEDRSIIRVEDDAGGIDSALLPSKIFDAYTTTYFKSRDKGLGLYLVRNIIRYRFGGEIEAKNIDGGAMFEITIPH